VQLVLDGRLLDEADLAPAARIGEQHVGRVGVIELAVNAVGAVAQKGEGQPVLRTRAGAAGAGIALIVDVVAVERRIAAVEDEAEVVARNHSAHPAPPKKNISSCYLIFDSEPKAVLRLIRGRFQHFVAR
jgi:hypothetical protein